MKNSVVLHPKPWQPGTGPAMIKVCAVKTGEMLFEDTIAGVADWLEIFGYKCNLLAGRWEQQ